MAHNKDRRGRINYGAATQRRGCIMMVPNDVNNPSLGSHPCGLRRVKHQLCSLHEAGRQAYAERLNAANNVYYENPQRRAKHAMMRKLNLSSRQYVRLRKERNRPGVAVGTRANWFNRLANSLGLRAAA